MTPALARSGELGRGPCFLIEWRRRTPLATSYLQAIRGFDRNVRLYLIAAALMGFTAWGGLFATLFNLYLLRLDYSPAVIGTVNAFGSLAFGFFCLPAGWIGSRWGNRRAMVAGLASVGMSQFLSAQALLVPESAQYGWLITTNIMGALGASFFAVNAGPYLMGVAATGTRSYAFSAQVAATPLGAFAGSLLGGFLPGLFAISFGLATDGPQAYRLALMVSAACLAPAALAMALAKDGDAVQESVSPTESGPAPWGFIFLMAAILALQVSSEGAIRTFFNVYLDEGLGVPTARIGMMASLGSLSAGLAALLTPLLIARMGISRSFVVMSLCMATLMLPIALIPWALAAGLSYAGVIGSGSMARPAMNIYLMESVPARWRSAIAAGATLSVGASWAVVAALGGVLIVRSGYSAMFLSAAGLSAAGALLFATYRRISR